MKKKVFSVVLLMLAGIAMCMAQSVVVKGKTIDKKENTPLGFTSIVLLKSDSVIVTGVMADEEGLFKMAAPSGDYILKASFIGYKDVLLPLNLKGNEVDAGILMMEEDSRMLQEVVVKSQLPKTTLKGDAVVTTIAGSVLEHSGNANDVIGKIPGMIVKNGSLEVLGRGTPVYYINGRKVVDDSELRNLMSEDIKSIDVVSNPGAIYGGDVRCVVRIKTIKRQGEGLSFALTSQAKKYTTCKDFDPSWSVLDINYRVGGWDFFGKTVYWMNHGYQISDIYGGTKVLKDGQPLTQIQDGTLTAKVHQGGFQQIVGTNWQIDNNHYLGVKLDFSNQGFRNQEMIMDNDFIVNDKLDDHVYSLNSTKTPESYQFTGNLYYDGTINKLNINFNTDFMTAKNIGKTNINETSWSAPVAYYSESKAKASMYACKLVLTYPVWKGSFQGGFEETYLWGDQQYSINKAEISAADGENKENTIAGFLQYGLSLPFGQLTAGLRYEHVDFNYYDYKKPSNDLTRHLDDWFPTVSFSTQFCGVGMSLSYTSKTQRPSLHYLSNEISYDNRFTYQTGDPTLLSQKYRTVSLQANWKWLTLSSTYETEYNHITQWAMPFDDNGTVLIKYANLDDAYHKFSMGLNASPRIGVWNPRYTVGIEKPYLKLHVYDDFEPTGMRVVERSKPMYFVQMDNAFRFKNNWQLECNYHFTSSMSHVIINISKPMHELGVSVQKSFLKDNALTFTLSWNDILNKRIWYAESDFGRYFINQSNDSRNPGVVLRVAYRFNSAKSKYKGTGAGEAAKQRM